MQRGSFLTGRDLLAEETGLTVQQVRTALDKLKSTNELTIKSSRQGTVVEVVNYDKYQTATNESTNEQPTSNQRVTSNKKSKNIEKDKNKDNNVSMVVEQEMKDKDPSDCLGEPCSPDELEEIFNAFSGLSRESIPKL